MKKILFVFVLGLMAWACGKDDEPEGTPMEMLAGTESKKWKLSFAEARDAEGASLPLMGLYPCWADNTLTLYADGRYTLEDTGTRCVDAEDISSTWVLSENGGEIKLANFSMAGITFENLTMELKEVKNSTFSGVAHNVTYGTVGVFEVELRFAVVTD